MGLIAWTEGKGKWLGHIQVPGSWTLDFLDHPTRHPLRDGPPSVHPKGLAQEIPSGAGSAHGQVGFRNGPSGGGGCSRSGRGEPSRCFDVRSRPSQPSCNYIFQH